MTLMDSWNMAADWLRPAAVMVCPYDGQDRDHWRPGMKREPANSSLL